MDQDQHKRDMDYLVSRMKQFKLVDMRENLPDLLAEARTNSMDHMDFLLMLFRTEEEGKLRRRHEKLLEGACFDSVHELEDINYGFNPSLDQDRISSLGRLGFLKAKENVIIIGEYSCQSGNHSDIIRISFQYYPDAEAAGTGTD